MGRPAEPWQRIVITGATGALGSALARGYAAPGIHLHLQGRRAAALAELAEACRGAGATVTSAPLDLVDEPARDGWLARLAAGPPPDLVIANAGANAHPAAGAATESPAEHRQLIELNLRAPLAMAEALLPPMVAAGRGQLALMGSLAAWHGLAPAPAYSATKAAIKAFGEGTRARLAGTGVGVSVILPGYVDSAMARGMPGPQPQRLQPERAAARIRAGLRRRRARIAFPLPLSLGCQWLSVLPAGGAEALLRWLGYRAGR